jgi:hypothetical protein
VCGSVAVDRARPIVGEPVLGVAGRNGSPDMAFHDNRWSTEGDGMEGAAIRWFWKEQYLVVELKVVLASLDGDRMMRSTKRCFRAASEWPARCFGRRLATCGFGVVIGPACGEYEVTRGGGDVAHQQLRGGGVRGAETAMSVEQRHVVERGAKCEEGKGSSLQRWLRQGIK